MVTKQTLSGLTLSARRACALSLCAILVVVASPFSTLSTERASALSDDQKKAFDRGIFYFDTELRGCSLGGVPTPTIPAGNSSGNVAKTLSGEVGKKVYQYLFNKFRGDGIDPVQSAKMASGFLGNFMWESHLDPAIISGPAHGLAQWEGGRWSSETGLLRFSEKRDRETGQVRGWQNADTQLDFVWHELKGLERGRYAIIKQATDVTDAATKVSQEYERPGIPHLDKRIEYAILADSIYSKAAIALAGQADFVAAGNDTSASCGGVSSCTGADTSYCWPVAPQTKRSYLGAPCPGPNEVPGYGARGMVGYYTNKYGVRSSTPIRTCHHEPLSPAFDLYYGPNNSRGTPIGAAGKPIYAITKGVIERVNENYCNPGDYGGCSSSSGQRCNSINFRSTLDGYWYWYGHVLFDKNISKGKEVTAGTQIGVVAPENYGPKCWGGAPHLHIDRGCVDKSGEKHPGGGTFCREPEFMKVMMEMWKGLPDEQSV